MSQIFVLNSHILILKFLKFSNNLDEDTSFTKVAVCLTRLNFVFYFFI